MLRFLLHHVQTGLKTVSPLVNCYTQAHCNNVVRAVVTNYNMLFLCTNPGMQLQQRTLCLSCQHQAADQLHSCLKMTMAYSWPAPPRWTSILPLICSMVEHPLLVLTIRVSMFCSLLFLSCVYTHLQWRILKMLLYTMQQQT